MGKKVDVTTEEKQKIVHKMALGMKISEIAREIQRDPRTVSKVLGNVNCARKQRRDKGKSMFTDRDVRKIKAAAKKKPLSTSKVIFQEAGIEGINRASRCKLLRKIATVKKPSKQPVLSKINQNKRIEWAKKYMKCDFSKVIFTDECRASLDGPDGWSKGWVIHGESVPIRFRRQQGGGGVMFWAGIVGNRLIGPFKVEEGVKMNSENYSSFLQANFIPWYRSQSRKFKKDCIFMHDNAPAHASHFTKAFLTSKNIPETKIMNWPPSSPDLNCIENLWGIIKAEIYEGNRQYTSKAALWEAIQKACSSVEASVIENLTKSMDERLLKVIEMKGGCIVH